MNNFKKSLRLAKKADKHWFHHPFTPKAESIDYWVWEGITDKIKRSLHKDNRGQRVFST